MRKKLIEKMDNMKMAHNDELQKFQIRLEDEQEKYQKYIVDHGAHLAVQNDLTLHKEELQIANVRLNHSYS